MRVMSIDASTTRTGVSIFDEEELIYIGAIEPRKDLEWRERVFVTMKELDKLVKEYQPNKCYVEDVPLVRNKSLLTLVILGFVQGGISGVMKSNGVWTEFVPVSTWRAKIGLFDGSNKGKERDEMKRKSIEKANELFGLNLIYKSPSSKFNQDDEADSCLLGYSQIIKKEEKRLGRKSKIK